MRGHQTIVFDWNGTLLDDLKASLEGFNAVLNVLGVREVNADRYRHDYNVPFITMYEKAGCDPKELRAREKDVHTIFHRTYEDAVKATDLREGAGELLQSLCRRRCLIVVLSNHTVADIRAQATRLGIRACFDAILANEINGGAYIKRGKGQRLKHYMHDHHLSGGSIVGDTTEEIEIARESHLQSFALTGGMCSHDRLHAKRPDHLVHSLLDIQPILEKGDAA
jgi:phosphoglycolate phosphatase